MLMFMVDNVKYINLILYYKLIIIKIIYNKFINHNSYSYIKKIYFLPFKKCHFQNSNPTKPL